MYTAHHISPMIPSFNLKKTIAFFSDILGFEIVMNSESYAILDKDGLTVHILLAGNDIGEMEFYLEVDNVDELWLSIKDKLDGVRFREPFDRDYGMREVHIAVPHTNTLLFIGQVIN